jgi:hypothetical protein
MLIGSLIDLHDLSKLPYMIEHYKQHKDKSEAFSLVDFFDLHYGGKSVEHDQEEHEKHQGLPFKSHHCSALQANSILQRPQPELISTILYTVSYNNFYQSTFSVEFSQSIWQPPRV